MLVIRRSSESTARDPPAYDRSSGSAGVDAALSFTGPSTDIEYTKTLASASVYQESVDGRYGTDDVSCLVGWWTS